MKRKGKVELHIEWSDECTIEIRYFDTRKEAEEYAKYNCLTDYNIY